MRGQPPLAQPQGVRGSRQDKKYVTDVLRTKTLIALPSWCPVSRPQSFLIAQPTRTTISPQYLMDSVLPEEAPSLDWAKHGAEILELFVARNKTLKEVKKHMEERYGFAAT